MSRGVQFALFGVLAVGVVVAVAGCSHNFYDGEREAWRRDAEIACLNSGAVKEGPDRVRISPISGPGMCGADFPIMVSALGEAAPLSYDDEPLRPPGSVPGGSGMPQHWPVQSGTLPPVYVPQSAAPPPAEGRPSPSAPAPLGAMASGARQATGAASGRPMSLYAPGVRDPEEDDAAFEPEPPQPYENGPGVRPGAHAPPGSYTPRAQPAPRYEQVPLGPPRGPAVTASAGPVQVQPPATLACPIVSALDQWITTAVQPAALHWFRQPVVEIKQISAYSCRGMNGNSSAHISEHSFGNALDIAGFVLADGRKISVQYGWRGSPEEQGFLHDVQLAACDEFSTVLAPGANIYHYNHIHVDLMRRVSARRICQPAAIPGEVAAERARRYAAQHDGDPGTTGSIRRTIKRALGYADDEGDRRPTAVPGDD